MNKIGVAVIGASPLNPGWAVKAHIPAVQTLPDYELRAVSTANENRPTRRPRPLISQLSTIRRMSSIIPVSISWPSP